MLSTRRGELAKDRELVRLQLFAGALDQREIVMRIDRRGGVAGKMFSAARDPLGAQGIVESPGQPNDFRDVAAVAAAAERVVGLVVEGNVEDRAKIEIEPEQPEQSPGDFAMPPHEIEIAFLAQLLGVRRLLPDQAQARNAAAFLVDRDDRLDRAQVAQVVDQLSQLRRALDVAPENDVSARLHAAKKSGRFAIEFFARDAGQDQLPR